MKKESIFNSFISTGSYQEFIDAIFSFVETKTPSYVCFANVHMVIEAYHDKAFQKIINDANLVAPDGRPLSVFLRLFKGIKQERVCGMDLLPDLLRWAEALGKSVYFYGTTDELLEVIIHKARNEFPTLRIAGCYAPPFKSSLSEEESSFALNKIKESKPDLVFVALGCPKQEKWMAENKDAIGACLLGLGQAFKVYAGCEKRLPRWMRNLSLEWAYRLYLEPSRLWKRYAYTNFYFLFLTLKFCAVKIFRGIRLIPLEDKKYREIG
jgi:N-acetylglucosaminyldiphosphoundecaprenol N-acetyl-beta-D-mannosaminyltransferase